jgi:acyl-CoA reductase-like NAD-dependent aldehyde dehydrogenase
MPSATELRTYGLYIGGETREASGGATFETVNPTTGQPWATIADASAEDVDAAVMAARRAFSEGEWSTMTAAQRGRLMIRLGDILRRDAEEIARAETTDNGKVYRETLAQAKSLGDFFDYFAGAADKLEGTVIPTGKPAFHCYTRNEPLGVVGAIMPWNSPLQLLIFKLAPALAAGCTVVAKPSEITPVSSLIFASKLEEAGFPPGVVNVITGIGPTSGKALVEHPEVDKVAFTGSTGTGKAVAQGALSHLARVSLELGGKSANVVFEDADIQAAVNGAIAGVFAATGQTCIAGSRLLLQESIADEFIERLVERSSRIKVGDPLDPETEMGPISNLVQYEKVEGMVSRAVEEGAKVLCGRGAGFDVPDGDGFFTAPTVLSEVDPSMEIDREEVFGPVTVVHTFKTEEEALEMANAGRFGLAAGLWTGDIGRSFRFTAALRAGTVWVNTYRIMGYAVPFGGFGESGIGRELGIDAVKSFTEVKSVWVELTGATRDPFVQG